MSGWEIIRLTRPDRAGPAPDTHRLEIDRDDAGSEQVGQSHRNEASDECNPLITELEPFVGR